MSLDFSSVWQYWPFLWHGAVLTLQMTFLCLICGFVLGVILSLIKISKCAPLVWFGRFTPLFSGELLCWCSCVSYILDFLSCWA